MGNSSLQIIAENISVIASAKTWIEGGAIQQLQTTAKLPGMSRVAGMPDLHPGRGYPVGAAFFSVGRMYPALIGGDIGCGMRFLKTDIPTAKLSVSKLVKRLGNLDAPLTDIPTAKLSVSKLVKRLGNLDAPLISLSDGWRQRVADFQLADTGFEQSLGTIGGGNHFAELQQFDEIFDGSSFAEHGLDAKQIMLLVHSGSRGFGGQILREHIDLHGHAGLLAGSSSALAYLEKHARALVFAKVNRELIAERICSNLSTHAETILDIHHNFLSEVVIENETGYLHRKGATPADQGLVLIPGSRGDYSYLVQPLESEFSILSLFSLAHGAGRKWMRSECEARLNKRYTTTQLTRTHFGSHVVCQDKALLFEEAPEAYKAIDTIISSLVETGLIRLVARLKPVLSYKTSGGCCV